MKEEPAEKPVLRKAHFRCTAEWRGQGSGQELRFNREQIMSASADCWGGWDLFRVCWEAIGACEQDPVYALKRCV